MRFMLALAFVVCLSAVAAAQDVTVLAELEPVSRQGAQMSPTARVTATPEQAAFPNISELQLVLTGLSTAAYEDPQTEIRVWLYKFDTSLVGNWRRMGGATFRGGRYVDEDGNVNPDPVFSLQLGGYVGKDVRCELDIPRRVTVGCRIQAVAPIRTAPIR